MTDEEWIAAYAYRYWKRHGKVDWPTVRQAARTLRLSQDKVLKAAESARLFKLRPSDKPSKARSIKAVRYIDAGDQLIEAATDAVRDTLARFSLDRFA